MLSLKHIADAAVEWLLWPSAALHELTHLLPVVPWLTSVDVHLRGEASVTCEVASDTPVWAIRLAAIAPTVVGVLIAGIIYVTVLAGSPLSYTVTIREGLAVEAGVKPLAWALCTAWWYWYTWPSEQDREQFQNPGGNNEART